MKRQLKKISRKIVGNDIPTSINILYALNDGRLAIGGALYLVIYNMKDYKVDLKICISHVNFILQLKDNKLFYSCHSHETEGPYIDDYFYNYLIEISYNNYDDKSSILPESSKYSTLREYSDKILFGGINYSIKESCMHSTNASGPKRIEQLIKKDGFEKYIINKTLNIDFIDFTPLKNGKLAVLCADNILFYDIDKFCKIGNEKIKNCHNLELFNEKFLLIGKDKDIIIYDYINHCSSKFIACTYPIKKIYVNKSNVFIAESNSDYQKAKNSIIEYTIDDKGYNKIVIEYYNPHNKQLVDVTKVNDGRMISCSSECIKIWSFK